MYLEDSVDGEERPLNPYADSMKMSRQQRLMKLGHPTLMLTTQYRGVAGLSQVYSEHFYGGRLTDGPGTELSSRPKAKEAIEFIKNRHGVYDGISHPFLNVPGGKCMVTETSFSRFNLHNIVVTISEILAILGANLWTQKQSVITTPYRAQAERYRSALRKADLFEIQLFTTDSFQGKEKKCVFWDYVLAKYYIGR